MELEHCCAVRGVACDARARATQPSGGPLLGVAIRPLPRLRLEVLRDGRPAEAAAVLEAGV